MLKLFSETRFVQHFQTDWCYEGGMKVIAFETQQSKKKKSIKRYNSKIISGNTLY